MCARTGVCAETHRRTHTHTHTQRGHLLCAHQATLAGHHRGRLGHTPDCQPRLPRPRIHPEAGSAAGPQGRAGPTGCGPGRVRRSPACHGTPPPPCFRRGGRWLTDALTTLSSGTDRLSVHSWLFTKASAKQEGNRKLDARSEQPCGGIFHPGRCGRSECARRLRLPVCILSPKHKACAAQ